MVSALFRCDSSFQIGTGHVYRCRSLARVLVRRGVDVAFICRPQPGDLIPLLRLEFDVWVLPALDSDGQEDSCAHSSNKDFADQVGYDSWLGCSQITDANQTIDLLSRNSVDKFKWLIVDHYGIDSVWEDLIINYVKHVSNTQDFQLAVIDDLINRCHSSDLLLDQNVVCQNNLNPYDSLVPPYCNSLLGPKYSLLGHEYSQLAPFAIARASVSRVLVFFGGSDINNCTLMALRALSDPAFSGLFVDVVLGKHSSNYSSVHQIVSNNDQFALYDSLPTLAFLIARADLAIGAVGSTSWERIALKLPTLGIAVATNQLAIANTLDQLGLIQYLGTAQSVNENTIINALKRFLYAPAFFNTNMHADGFGAHRVATALFGPHQKYSLRSVSQSDAELLFHWSNDPLVRLSSINKEVIAWDDHLDWFTSGLLNPDRLHFVFEDFYNCPIGQIRFDRVNDSLDTVISFSVDSVFRGFGLSERMLSLGFERLMLCWPGDFLLVADVYPINRASMSVFSRFGFVRSDETNANGTVRWTRKPHLCLG